MRKALFAGSLTVCFLCSHVTSIQLDAQEVDREISHPALVATIDPARIQEALASLDVLLQHSRAKGDRRSEANTLSVIANSYNSLRKRQKAIEQFQAARDIWHQLGDKDHEATVTAHIGDVYRLWGFPEQANRYYREALAQYPADDKTGRGATLNNLGLTFFSLNNRRRCFESLDQALAIFRQLEDRHGEGLALANLGAAYIYLMNDPLKAIGALQQATTKLDVVNDRVSQAGALDQMGVAWHMLGKSEMAGLSFERSLALFHAVGDVQGEAAVRKHMKSLGEQQTQATSR